MGVRPGRPSVHRSDAAVIDKPGLRSLCRGHSAASIRQSHAGRNKRLPNRSNRLQQYDTVSALTSARREKKESKERSYLFAAFPAAAFFPPPLPSSSSALRTCLNSCSDALSARGNRKFSVSSALTMAEPITTRANHL